MLLFPLFLKVQRRPNLKEVLAPCTPLQTDNNNNNNNNNSNNNNNNNSNKNNNNTICYVLKVFLLLFAVTHIDINMH